MKKARRVGRGVPSPGCEVGGTRHARDGQMSGRHRGAPSRDTPIVERRRARVGGITRPPASTGDHEDRENASDEHDIGARATVRRPARVRGSGGVPDGYVRGPCARSALPPSEFYPRRHAARVRGRERRRAPAPAGAWNQVGLPILISGASVSCATACTNPSTCSRCACRCSIPQARPAPPRRLRAASAATRAAPREWARLSHSSCDTKVHSRLAGITLSPRAPAHGASAWASTNPSPTPSTASADGFPPDGPASGSDADARQPSTPRVHRPGGAWQTKKDKEATDDASATAHKPDTTTNSRRLASGGLAAALLNPTELVKTRMMADATARGRAGRLAPFTSRGPIAIVLSIVRAEGLRGLWKGADEHDAVRHPHRRSAPRTTR